VEQTIEIMEASMEAKYGEIINQLKEKIKLLNLKLSEKDIENINVQKEISTKDRLIYEMTLVFAKFEEERKVLNEQMWVRYSILCFCSYHLNTT